MQQLERAVAVEDDEHLLEADVAVRRVRERARVDADLREARALEADGGVEVAHERAHVTAAALAADPWPSKPVRFIVPFPPGGPVDTTARVFSHRLSEIWKTPTVIDNRAGAGGVVGATAAAKEAPDGYGLFVGAIHHSVNPSLMGKLPYDIEKDFAPISFAAMFPVFIVAHPSVPANTIQELIALAKKGTPLA